MARSRRRTFKPNIFATISNVNDENFESINEVFEEIIPRIVLVTAEGEYLLTSTNDKIKE